MNKSSIISKTDLMSKIKWIAILCMCGIAAVGWAQTNEGPDWFKLSDATNEKWESQFDPAQPLRFRLVQRDPASTESAKKIYALFPKASSAYETAIDKITEVFYEQSIHAEIMVVNFEGDAVKGAQALGEISNYDLLFSVGSVSTAYIHNNLDRVDIPVVSVTSKDPVLLGQIESYDRGSGTNMSFTSLNVPINVQTSYMFDLKSNLTNIAVLYARNNTSAYETQVVPLYDVVAEYSLNLFEIIVEDQQNAAAELARIIPSTIAQMKETDPELQNSIFWITGSTSVFREIETINAYSGKVPVLSTVSDVVTEGENSAAMSIGVSFESNAHIAAAYAIDILVNGASPGDLAVGVVTPPDVSINFLKTRTIGLVIPFDFFELANVIYGIDGKLARLRGVIVQQEN